jgi:hypothetical protein
MSPTKFQVLIQRVGNMQQRIISSGAENDGPSSASRASSAFDPSTQPHSNFAPERIHGIDTPRSQMARLGFIRYLSPAHQYLDQFAHYLHDSPLNANVCKRCFGEDCEAEHWTQCTRPCGTCDNDQHYEMVRNPERSLILADLDPDVSRPVLHPQLLEQHRH